MVLFALLMNINLSPVNYTIHQYQAKKSKKKQKKAKNTKNKVTNINNIIG